MPTFWSMRCCNRTGLRARTSAREDSRDQDRSSRALLPLSLALCAFCFCLPLRALAATNLPTPVFHGSLKAATEAAASDQSLVLLIFGADWCAPCKMLKAKTL